MTWPQSTESKSSSGSEKANKQQTNPCSVQVISEIPQTTTKTSLILVN